MDMLFRVTENNVVITNWGLIILCCLPGLVSGLRRGWQEEGFTSIGLVLAITSIGQAFASFLITIANNIAAAFPLGIALLTGQPAPSSREAIIPQFHPWAQMIAFLLIVMVTYRAGSILGRRQGIGLFGRIAGGIFGVTNVLLIFIRSLDILNPLQTTTVVDPPTFTIEGVTPAVLQGAQFGLIALIVALFLAMAWVKRRRIRE